MQTRTPISTGIWGGILETDLSPGGLFGYSSVSPILSLIVPSSKGVPSDPKMFTFHTAMLFSNGASLIPAERSSSNLLESLGGAPVSWADKSLLPRSGLGQPSASEAAGGWRSRRPLTRPGEQHCPSADSIIVPFTGRGFPGGSGVSLSVTLSNDSCLRWPH